MKKISNSDELNHYYGKVNKFIDDYIKIYKVSPIEIYRYINKNMNKFLEKYGIKEIENIDKVVKDVIEHRRNMEKDRVFKFEQFSVLLTESLLYLNPATVDHEKILADYYNTSLGHITVVDSELHLYEVKDFNKVTKSIIFSSNEFSEIKEKIKLKILEELNEVRVDLNSIDDQVLNKSFSFLLGSIMSKELLLSNLDTKLNNETLIDLVTTLLPNSLVGKSTFFEVKFKENFKDFFIWEM